MSVRRRAGALAAGVAVGLVLLSTPAGAEVDGGCVVKIDGVDITNLSASKPDAAVDLAKDARVVVQAVSPRPITGYVVKLDFLGFQWTVAEGTANGNQWSRTVDVGDYSRYGAGLYKVIGVSTGPGACTGAALVHIQGNGLFTPAGVAGVVLAGLGLAGMAFTARSAAQAVVR